VLRLENANALSHLFLAQWCNGAQYLRICGPVSRLRSPHQVSQALLLSEISSHERVYQSTLNRHPQRHHVTSRPVAAKSSSGEFSSFGLVLADRSEAVACEQTDRACRAVLFRTTLVPLPSKAEGSTLARLGPATPPSTRP